MAETKGKVVGKVFWEGKEKTPVTVSTVCAISTKDTNTTLTDKDGAYSFDGLELNTPWTLVALRYDGKPQTQKLDSISSDPKEQQEPVNFVLHRTQGTPSRRVGALVIFVLIAMIFLLGFTYWHSHENALSQYDTTELNQSLKYIDDLIVAGNTIDSGKFLDLEKSVMTFLHHLRNNRYTGNQPAYTILGERMDSLREVRLETSRADNTQSVVEKRTALVNEYRQLRKALQTVKPSYYWSNTPWFLAELWCWGMLGLLVQKIMRIGWYLYKDCYYAEGTWMHFTQLIAVPILGVVATILLSMVQFKSASGVVVDLSNSEAIVLVAFLLCLFPWRVYDFVRGRGEEMFQSKK